MTVTDEVLEALAVLATPTLANALDDVAFEGVMEGLGQMVPGTRCAGRAVTVREVAGRRGDFSSDDFKVGQVIDAARAGDILVIDNGGACVSTFGGLATLAAKVKGIGGLVADGGVRDREEMIEHAFPVFARHMTPLTGRTRSGRARGEGRGAGRRLCPRRRAGRGRTGQGAAVPRGDGPLQAHLSRPAPARGFAGRRGEARSQARYRIGFRPPFALTEAASVTYVNVINIHTPGSKDGGRTAKCIT
jgi:hypothetical protein